jgi:hypothetical protein
VPPWQLCPQLPQLNLSVWKSVQLALQALGVAGGQAHAVPWQVVGAGQLFAAPQVPDGVQSC